jgi:2-iminoacetate synthase
MFSEELAKYDWEETTRQIQHKRPADVETALGKEHLTLDDFMALISPAAAAYLEPMARIALHSSSICSIVRITRSNLL